MISDGHFDRAALDAAVRYLERQGEEGQGHAASVRKAIIAHEALADRLLTDTAELRASIGRMREIVSS